MGADRQLAGGSRRGRLPQHLDRILIGDWLERGQRPGDGVAVGEKRQARLQKRRDCRGLPCRERRIGKLRRRVDPQLVRDIEIVQYQPPCQALAVTWASR